MTTEQPKKRWARIAKGLAKSRTWIRDHWPLIVAALAAGAVVGFYVLTFGDTALSPSPPEWGTFGDYVGGILNPIAPASLALYGSLLTVPPSRLLTGQ